ncbi:hypothetical protein [uncultured Shimia sp.]|uniref:hypothetical protein n=1 Tax=uncultured Shimia sp. TaxID=573152 RepID=UPI0026119BEF|nr:hypothetical protein [uncultured Shimia sp.]
MYVNAIEITEIPSEETPERAQASVAFLSYERQIQVVCDLREAPAAATFKRKVALMRDALRQLKRMPEFRAGRAVLEFQPGILPEGAQA